MRQSPTRHQPQQSAFILGLGPFTFPASTFPDQNPSFPRRSLPMKLGPEGSLWGQRVSETSTGLFPLSVSSPGPCPPLGRNLKESPGAAVFRGRNLVPLLHSLIIRPTWKGPLGEARVCSGSREREESFLNFLGPHTQQSRRGKVLPPTPLAECREATVEEGAVTASFARP